MDLVSLNVDLKSLKFDPDPSRWTLTTSSAGPVPQGRLRSFKVDLGFLKVDLESLKVDLVPQSGSRVYLVQDTLIQSNQ